VRIALARKLTPLIAAMRLPSSSPAFSAGLLRVIDVMRRPRVSRSVPGPSSAKLVTAIEAAVATDWPSVNKQRVAINNHLRQEKRLIYYAITGIAG